MSNTRDARISGGRIGSSAEVDAKQRGEDDSVGLLPADSSLEPVVSVVIPTLNEEEGIAECIRSVKNALRELDLLGEVIISDSSTDRTPEIARELGAIVVTPDEPGYGYAYRYAFEHARGEYIAIGDADTTYDFEELPKLLEPVRSGEADMCMGSRLDGEIKDGAMPPLHQYVGNPLLTKFLNVFYDAGVSDAHSGFRVFRRDLLDTLALKTTGMEFASEMIMEAGARDLTIVERPIVYHEREGEATLDSFRDGWRHVKFMLQNAPGYLFTGPAIALGLLGTGLLLASMLGSTFYGLSLSVHTAIAGCMALIVGYQVGSLSVFSSMTTNPIRAPTDPVTGFIKNHFELQHGGTVGVVLLAIGGSVLTYFAWKWVSSGLIEAPSLVSTIIGVTIVLLGVQTLFYSFFLSMLAESTHQ